jgi:Na+/H+ antiporter NhaD/arsenite permease-like protein
MPPEMSTEMWLALVIFALTYVLISIRRFRWFNVERPMVALLGAGLMILLGVVGPEEALQAIDLNTLALLLGMMILVGCLEVCGFFTWVSLRIISRSKNRLHLLVLVMVVTAVLSALILNDTVVLLFTPIIIRTCMLIKSDPVPYMVAIAISANIGSVATAVGNPQNAYIATQSGISFIEFSAALLPIAVVSMLVAIPMVWLVFRKDLKDGSSRNGRIIDAQAISKQVNFKGMDRSIWLVGGIILAVFIGFIITPFLGVPLAVVAFVGGSLALFLVPLTNKKASSKAILQGVDWTLLLFFIGLFIVLKGVETSGLLQEMEDAFQSVSHGGLSTIPGLSFFTALLSNLISNVPAVILLTPFVASIGETSLWLALAASSTLAGNATILGAAANVIVAENGEKLGVQMPFWRFLKAGLPVTIITLVISIIILQLLA